MAEFRDRVTGEIRTGTNSGQVIAPVSPAVDRSSEQRAETFSSLVDVGVEVAGGIVKSNFKDDLSKIEDQQALFNETERDTIGELTSAMTASDSKVIDSLSDKLIALRRNSDDNLLSSTEAKIRANKILKQNINSTPWLAPELKQIASVYNLGSGSGSGASDGFNKAFNKMQEVRALTGRPISSQISKNKREQALEEMKVTGEINGANAVAVASIDTYAGYADLNDELMSASFNNVNYDPKPFVDRVENIRVSHINNLNKEFANIQAQTGAIISQTDKDTIFKQANDVYDTLIERANSKDRLKLLRDQKELNELLDDSDQGKYFPYVSVSKALDIENPEKNIVEVHRALSKLTIGDKGPSAILEQELESGGRGVGLALKTIRAAGAKGYVVLPENVMRRISIILDPSRSINDTDDTSEIQINQTISGESLRSATFTKPRSEAFLQYTRNLLGPVTDETYKYINNPAVLGKMDERTKKDVVQVMNNRITGMADEVGQLRGTLGRPSGIWTYNRDKNVLYQLDKTADGADIEAGLANIDNYLKTGKRLQRFKGVAISTRSPAVTRGSIELNRLLRTLGNYGEPIDSYIGSIIAKLNATVKVEKE